MDNASAGTHSILDTLRTVEFRLGLKGYNVDEVDEYLEKAAVEAEQVKERLRTADERLRAANERVAQLEVELSQSAGERSVALEPGAPGEPAEGLTADAAVTADTLQRTLLLAQKFVDQTKRESETEAAQVVSAAEERSRAVIEEAEERAKQLVSDAELRLRDEVARLQESRERLASDVEAMSGHLEDRRTKIRASLTEMLRLVDERMSSPADETDEPAAQGAPGHRAPDRKPSGEAGGSASRVESGGGGSPERPSSETARTQAESPVGASTSERTQSAGGSRPGALFEVGREQPSRLQGRRLGG